MGSRRAPRWAPLQNRTQKPAMQAFASSHPAGRAVLGLQRRDLRQMWCGLCVPRHSTIALLSSNRDHFNRSTCHFKCMPLRSLPGSARVTAQSASKRMKRGARTADIPGVIAAPSPASCTEYEACKSIECAHLTSQFLRRVLGCTHALLKMPEEAIGPGHHRFRRKACEEGSVEEMGQRAGAGTRAPRAAPQS